MPQYITLEIDTEPSDVLQEIYDYLQSRITGWEPAEGNLDTWMSEAYAEVASDIRTMASQVPPTIFRYFGASIIGLPPIDASSATTTTTWTARDSAGHTVPDGTQVGIRNSAGELVPFVTIGDVVIPPGSTATTTGAVTILAINPGSDTSGLGSAGGTVELVDLLDWVSGVVATAATVGGVDAELDDDYLNRLRTRMTLLTPAPILPRDFAILARDIAGVFRSTAIDGLIPPSTTGQERAVAVAMIDESGSGVSSPVKANVVAYLESLREVNFIVNAIDPTVTVIDVTVEVKARPGFSDVDDAVTTAIEEYLSPATWGIPADGALNDWDLVTAVRYLELAEVINRVDAVDYITTSGGNFNLTMRIPPAAHARADITLTGFAPLPNAGTVLVTVV